MTTEPSKYPAQCDVSAAELSTLKEAFLDEDRPFGEMIDGGWPPTDASGNVYPIWFTYDDIDDYGKLYDSNWTRYDPFGGNLEPIERETWGCCNAPLNNWRERYPEIRFCGRFTNSPSDEAGNPTEYTYCPVHKNRKHTMQTAEERMQSGLFTKSIDHLYENLSPFKKLIGWGAFESLMGESSYEFGVEYRQRTFDFSDAELTPDGVEEDGTLTVRCGYPTQYLDPALSLYVAAMMGVQMLTVQPRIMYENREQGQGMMESRNVEAAQLTAPPSEHDPSPQKFKTLETWGEHHLNLPFSRIVRDRPKLLERGGVEIDPESNDETKAGDDIVLEIAADPDEVETAEDTGTDPNAFGEDYTSKSEKIAESAGDGE